MVNTFLGDFFLYYFSCHVSVKWSLHVLECEMFCMESVSLNLLGLILEYRSFKSSSIRVGNCLKFHCLRSDLRIAPISWVLSACGGVAVCVGPSQLLELYSAIFHVVFHRELFARRPSVVFDPEMKNRSGSAEMQIEWGAFLSVGWLAGRWGRTYRLSPPLWSCDHLLSAILTLGQ